MDWESARNILCIRLDYMGDVLMTTPAIRALKHRHPERRITLMTSSSGAAIAHYIPEIDEAMIYDAPWVKHSRNPPPESDLKMIEQVRDRHFDAAVIFTVFSQNPLPAALFCTLAGIPLRLAYCRENPYQLLTDWQAETEPHQQVRHEVRRQLDLVAATGHRVEDERMSLSIPVADTAFVEQILLSRQIDKNEIWIVMHPGATAASRRYPATHWIEAGRLLSKELQCPIVFTGSAEEAVLIDSIISGIEGNCHSLAGMLDLGQLAAVIHEAPLIISNNTGPAHLAAAVGTPIVDLYALTNPQHTPWQVPSRVLYHDVPCKFCYKSICPEKHHDCLVKVPPEKVKRAALELLGNALFDSNSPSCIDGLLTADLNRI